MEHDMHSNILITFSGVSVLGAIHPPSDDRHWRRIFQSYLEWNIERFPEQRALGTKVLHRTTRLTDGGWWIQVRRDKFNLASAKCKSQANRIMIIVDGWWLPCTRNQVLPLNMVGIGLTDLALLCTLLLCRWMLNGT